MNIAVCIKQVPVSGNVTIDPVTHRLVRDSSETMINPADLNALEAALALKEKTGGKITVLTMGPDNAEKSLRIALSMGVDDVCLITDKCFGGGDTIATSKVLVESLKRLGSFDLILTGNISSDGATAQIGPMMAEYMAIPHITEVQEIDCENSTDSKIQVIKKFQNVKVRVNAVLPALLTICYGCNEPRLTTLRSQMAAKKKPVTVFTNAELQMAPGDIGLEGSPTVVTDTFEPEVKKITSFLSGEPKEIAQQIADLINKEKGNN